MRRTLEELAQGAYTLATAVHEHLGFLQAAIHRAQLTTRNFTLKSCLATKALPASSCQLIHKPKPGVMPGWFVLGTGVTQPDDQLYRRH